MCVVIRDGYVVVVKIDASGREKLREILKCASGWIAGLHLNNYK